MSNNSIEYLKERKCSQDGCFNIRVKGYIYCENHLYGFPQRMDEEDIRKLKEEQETADLEIKYGKILDEFIRTAREWTQIGSGDDLSYEMQVEKYINQQRIFWLNFIGFLENKFKKRLEHIGATGEFIVVKEQGKTGLDLIREIIGKDIWD